MINQNMLYGVHIGEHGFDPDGIIEEINERVIKPGYNFVTIRTRARQGDILPEEYYLKWAKYLKENKIYFLFLYTIKTGEELKGSINKETVQKMKEIAGEYFLGDMVGELGSCFGAKHAGYGVNPSQPFVDPKQDFEDVKSACDAFVGVVKSYTDLDRSIGMPHVASVEPTALSKYIDMGGVDLPMVELMCAAPDLLVSYMRGMAAAFGRTWGSYMAHEWYGGVRHTDTLKRKRLVLGAKYAYLSGSKVFCIESGDEMVTAYGDKHGTDSEICSDYRNMLDSVKVLADTDLRDEKGPRVKFAFVSGRYDAFAGWGGSSAWGQYGREEWGHSEAEHSYRLLYEIGTKRNWYDIENYGDEDLSPLPAYGMYDIVPIEANLEALSKYDYLVFLGWNTMTDGDMDKLTEYVRRGGRLLMSFAHLNYSTKRRGEFIPPSNDKLKELFGVEFTGETLRTNAGVKFADSIDSDVLYPRTLPDKSDPILTSGYVEYACLKSCGANVTAMLSDGFTRDTREYFPAMVENRVGKGTATLVLSMNYPGHPAAYPLYRVVARELVSASARGADIKVVSSDKLRYSVYEDGKVYMLNTDYDLPIIAIVKKGEKTLKVEIEPLELKILTI